MVKPLDFSDARDHGARPVGLCWSCVHAQPIGPVVVGPDRGRIRGVICGRHPRPAAAYFAPRPARCSFHCEASRERS